MTRFVSVPLSTEEDDMTPEEVQAMIDASVNALLRRDHPRMYCGRDISESLLLKSTNATVDMTLAPWCPVLNSSQGANQFLHAVVERSIQTDELFTLIPNAIYGIRAFVHAWGVVPIVPDSVFGIQMGSPHSSGVDTAPPWDNPSGRAFIRLYADMFNGVWTVASSVGDGVTPTAYFPTDATCGMFTDYAIELLYDPSVPAVKAFVNGEQVTSITDPGVLPRFDSQDGGLTGYFGGPFVETGDDVGEHVRCNVGGFTCYTRNYPADQYGF